MTAFGLLAASAGRRTRDSALLAASTAVSAMAIAVFAAAGGSPAFAGIVETRETVRLLFLSASLVMAFFVALSGWFYAGHYLKRRKRELASLLLLGMRKDAVVLLLSLEFAAAAALALAAGLGLAALFSRFFGLCLGALMKGRTPMSLKFDPASAAAAGLACLAQWTAATARGAWDLSRTSVLGLFKSERETEYGAGPRGAERTGRTGRSWGAGRALAPFGALLLGLSYSGAALAEGPTAERLMIPVLLGTIAGSFLVFEALAPRLVGRFREGGRPRDPALMVAAAQVAFRSRRNARLLAFGSVLVAVAAASLGSVMALNERDEAVARRMCPNGVEFTAAGSEGEGAAAAALVEAILSEAGARRWRRVELARIEGTLRTEDGEARPASLFEAEAASRLFAARGEEPVAVEAGRASSFLASRLAGRAYGAESRPVPLSLEAGGHAERLVSYPAPSAPPLSLISANAPVLLSTADWRRFEAAVPAQARLRVYAWNGLGDRELRAARPRLEEAGIPGLLLKPRVLDEQAGQYGILLFIGSFMAATFILAAAALLAFRSIEDARDDAERYRTLLGLGAGMEVVKKSLRLQNAFAFGLPLLLGLCHSAFALAMLKNISGQPNLGPTLTVSAGSAVAFALFAGLAARRQSEAIRADAASRGLAL